MFAERMKLEGKWPEFNRRRREIQEEKNIAHSPALWLAMYEFGYEKGNPDAEKKRYKEAVDNWARTQQEKQLQEMQEEIREEQKITDFETALATLPFAADPLKELTWIRAHPAMSRRDRQSKDRRVIIDANDVLYAAHGPAPSQAAVHQLQNWCNRAPDFHKQMLSEYRKLQGKEDGSDGAESEEDLSGVKQLLQEVIDGSVEGSEGDGRGDSGDDVPDGHL